MGIFVIFVVWALVVNAFKTRGGTWGDALLLASTSLAFMVATATELLSSVGALNPWTVSCLWTAAAAGGFWCGDFRSIAAQTRLAVRELSWLWLAYLGVACALVAIAFTWPPNNFDTMVYHMPRVMAWEQSGSIDHYPTIIFRQLYQPPLFEYFLLHARFMGGGEYVFTVIPVLILLHAGMIAGCVLTSFDCKKHAVALGALLVVTLPVAALQASAPKNDIFLGLWALYIVYGLHRFWATKRLDLLVCSIIAIFMAILTKGTSWALLPGLTLATFLAIWRSNAGLNRRGYAIMFLSFVLGVAVVLPHHLRNLRTFGNPLTSRVPKVEAAYGNETHGAKAVLSNVARNIALELQTPFPSLNQPLQSSVEYFHQILGVDSSDPATTWPGTKFDVRGTLSFGEDSMTNTIPVLLVLCSILFAWFLKRGEALMPVRILTAVFILSCLVFCFLLKWQPWHSRLHIPFLFLGLVIVAFVADRLTSSMVQFGLALLQVAIVLATLMHSPTRPLPLSGRVFAMSRDQRFQKTYPSYISAANEVVAEAVKLNPARIGLISNTNQWEYLIRRALEGARRADARLDHYDSPISDANSMAHGPRSTVFIAFRDSLHYAVGLRESSAFLRFSNAYFDLYVRPDFLSRDGAKIEIPRECMLEFLGHEWYSMESNKDTNWRWCKGVGEIRIRTPIAGSKVRLRMEIGTGDSFQGVAIETEQGTSLGVFEARPGARAKVDLELAPPSAASEIMIRLIAHHPVLPPVGSKDQRVLSFSVINCTAVTVTP